MRLLIRWAITAAAVWVAAFVVPGINIGDNGWIAVAVMGAVLGVVNAVIRPILKFASCGLIILTLGLFTFVVNALAFELAAAISQSWFGVAFTVDGFWPALWGSIIVSIVSVLLSVFVPDPDTAATQ